MTIAYPLADFHLDLLMFILILILKLLLGLTFFPRTLGPMVDG